jgi:hypothetical protein
MTGIAGCCARAASGHTAPEPMSVMNARRFTAQPGASDGKDSTSHQPRQEAAALRDRPGL